LVGEDLAHPLARRIHRDAAEPARGRGEIHVLEDAEPAALVRREVRDRDGPAIVDAQHLAGRDIAHELRADRVERARLARDQPRAALSTEAQRANAERIADRIERGRREEDERPRAHERRQRMRDALVPAGPRRVRDRLRDDLGVGGGDEADALVRKPVAYLAGVDAVAVVPDGRLAESLRTYGEGLCVLDL